MFFLQKIRNGGIVFVAMLFLAGLWHLPVRASTSGDAAASADASLAAAAALLGGSSGEAPAERVLAYYFHGTQRCPTCQNIERFAHEAVTTGFGAELASGTLEWHSLDVMTPEHRHFIQDFQLVAQSVVLVRMAGERMVAWKNLDQVWPLAHDREASLKYVAEELRGFLQRGTTP